MRIWKWGITVVAVLAAGCDDDYWLVADPPDAPRDLDGYYYAGAVDLSWRLGGGWDGEAFRVYGKRVSDPDYFFIAEVTSCTEGLCVYRDINVRAEVTYEYYVSAVSPDTGEETASDYSVEVYVPRPVPPPVPDPVEALLELSNVMFAQSRADEAMDYLSRARELRPNDPTTLVNAGEALRKAERIPEAMALYRETLQIDPGFAPAQVGLGAALFDLERYDEALESLTRSMQPDLDAGTAATAHYLAARALLEMDRKDEAAAQFERALEQEPNHTEALDYLAHLRFGQKKYEAALDLYRTQAPLKPGSATVHANIGVTLYFLGRHAEALEKMEHVLRLDPDHPMARKMVAQLRQEIR